MLLGPTKMKTARDIAWAAFLAGGYTTAMQAGLNATTWGTAGRLAAGVLPGLGGAALGVYLGAPATAVGLAAGAGATGALITKTAITQAGYLRQMEGTAAPPAASTQATTPGGALGEGASRTSQGVGGAVYTRQGAYAR